MAQFLEMDVDGCKFIIHTYPQAYQNLLEERIKSLAEEFDTATEIREISWAFGPDVTDSNFRITYGTPGNYHVSDWHIGWEDTDSPVIVYSDEYDRIM